jgi:DNA-binding beta-propeller fold protein YncE
MYLRGSLLGVFAAVCVCLTATADDYDSLRVQRKEIFEFTEKPTVEREGNRVTIRFASKDYCDATIAIEDEQGRIIRHLVSGVLGKNAPQPFQKNSLKQAVVWDGKDDQGDYVENLDAVTVRVSLGLRPRLERTLLWSPHRRFGGMPLLAAGPEGVYVYDGRGVDFIRLYSHQGDYIRSVYPFPRDSIERVEGLKWYDFPQGYRLPLKGGLYQLTLLTSGENYHSGNHAVGRSGTAANSMCLRGDWLTLAGVQINRLRTDGGTGGLPLAGPKVGHTVSSVADNTTEVHVGPSSIAMSPDGKTLYGTAYLWRTGSWRKVPGCFHVVLKIDYEKNDPPVIFKGHKTEYGTDNEHFRVPTSVATDAGGRVYVSDFFNNRIQIYDAAGEHLRTIKADNPAKVCVHQKTGEIWVFSYPVLGIPYEIHKQQRYKPDDIEHTLTRFSALPEAKRISQEPFPLGFAEPLGFEYTGHLYRVELDSWAGEPTVWVVGRKHNPRGAEFRFSGAYNRNDTNAELWKSGVRIQQRVDGQWQVVRSFGEDTAEKVVRPSPPRHNIQRLMVNPASGKLYVAEADSGPTMKASNEWLEIDPAVGDKSIKIVKLPFNAMEGAFDLDGNVYLRNTDSIVRYAFPSFREIPWDYGEEFERLGNDGGINGRATAVKSALKMPATSPVCYHQGGFHVSPRGDVIASCAYRYVGISSGRLRGEDVHEREVYKPRVFPGRVVNSTSPCIHIWDKHGQLKVEDAIPGVGQCDGVGIDNRGDIYVMHAPTRVYNGQRYFNEMSQTLMKVRPGQDRGKVVSSKGSPIDLGDADRPDREPDLESTRHGKAWVQDAEWMYGGVGFAGFNMIGHGGGCACWFSRFKLDYFARSIAPEPYQYRVAVVDSAGNLILQIGDYGNVEDGKPLIADGGPPNTRSIGGDEVSLMHACFVGTHTDRRIFISDLGNQRIVSVKLDYHAEQRIPLTQSQAE